MSNRSTKVVKVRVPRKRRKFKTKDPINFPAIRNKYELINCVNNAFPEGLPFETLQKSYTYAENDINALIFDNKCFVHTFKDSKTIFRKPDVHPILLEKWEETFNKNWSSLVIPRKYFSP